MLYEVLDVVAAEEIHQGTIDLGIAACSGEIWGIFQCEMNTQEAPMLPLPEIDLLDKALIEVVASDEL